MSVKYPTSVSYHYVENDSSTCLNDPKSDMTYTITVLLTYIKLNSRKIPKTTDILPVFFGKSEAPINKHCHTCINMSATEVSRGRRPPSTGLNTRLDFGSPSGRSGGYNEYTGEDVTSLIYVGPKSSGHHSKFPDTSKLPDS